MALLALLLFLVFQWPTEDIRSRHVINHGRGAEVVSRVTTHDRGHQEHSASRLTEGINVFHPHREIQSQSVAVEVGDFIGSVQIIEPARQPLEVPRSEDIALHDRFPPAVPCTRAHGAPGWGGIIQLRFKRTFWIPAIPLDFRIWTPIERDSDMLGAGRNPCINKLVSRRVDHGCDLRLWVIRWNHYEWVKTRNVNVDLLHGDRNAGWIPDFDREIQSLESFWASLASNGPISRLDPLLISEPKFFGYRRSADFRNCGLSVVLASIGQEANQRSNQQKAAARETPPRHGNELLVGPIVKAEPGEQGANPKQEAERYTAGGQDVPPRWMIAVTAFTAGVVLCFIVGIVVIVRRSRRG